jgi:serine/threonine protein kinase
VQTAVGEGRIDFPITAARLKTCFLPSAQNPAIPALQMHSFKFTLASADPKAVWSAVFSRSAEIPVGKSSMDSPLAKPRRIGAYDIIDVIGRGGMGTVFRGNDPRIGRPVAIKMLTAAVADADLLQRFYREAQYTGSLHHQNIVTVYELGHEENVPYLVMEYLEGLSLETMIVSRRPMPIAEKLGIILQVCSGLTYAHKRGLVHRDIKPANIVILEDGTAKIVDFGIALLGGSTLTRTGQVVGSFNYMSPEQLNGVEVDARTDVYSTGVVLFQLLTGVLPFEGATTAATLMKIVQDPPPMLGQYMPECPPELDAIIHRALVKNRDERYASPEEFAIDLARVHQQYLKHLLADTLRDAEDAMRRKDFTSAREQVLRVLRSAPQSIEGAELLRQIRQGLDHQQREQQILQLQMKAEEAFRKNQLNEALQFAEQGTQLDPTGTVFSGLREAIAEAKASAGQFPALLRRAESALRAGDVELTKRLVEEAQQSLPDDPGARALASQIVERLERQLRDKKLVGESSNPQTDDLSEAPMVTSALDDITPPLPTHSVYSRLGNEAPHAVPEMHDANRRSDVLHPIAEPSRAPGEIAPELREFFEPEAGIWSRPMTWIIAVAVILICVAGWLIVRPKSIGMPPVAADYTYTEINAEPWATVTALTPANGDAQSAIGQQTPLRVKLPPGDYSVTLQGPNEEQKRIDITVPQHGGATCFAVFNKPDLNRIVGTE